MFTLTMLYLQATVLTANKLSASAALTKVKELAGPSRWTGRIGGSCAEVISKANRCQSQSNESEYF